MRNVLQGLFLNTRGTYKKVKKNQLRFFNFMIRSGVPAYIQKKKKKKKTLLLVRKLNTLKQNKRIIKIGPLL